MPNELQFALDALERMTGYAPHKSGSGWQARCPCHDDQTASLSVSEGDTKPVVVFCHAGCESRSVLKAIGINGVKPQGKQVVACYQYVDASSNIILEKVRFFPKDFRCRHKPTAGGDYVWKRPSGEIPLYHLPAVLAAIASGDTIYIVEGEKDCDRLAALGLVATCNFDGAGKWRPSYTETLKPASRLVVIPDNDAPGAAHADRILRELPQASRLDLPGLTNHGDVSDWLDAGHTLADLLALEAVHSPPGATVTEVQPSAPVQFHLTDCGNAERLVAQCGDNLRYCHDWKRWLVWDGRRWTQDRDGLITRQTKAVARSILSEAASIEDDDRRKETVKFAFRSETRDKQTAMAELAQHDLAVLPEALDAQPWLLNCLNGTLDLRTGKLRSHARADLLTKMAPVIYDPAATCPTWLRFLDRVFGGNQPLIEFIRQSIGYALTGSTREQCIFILHGSGRNGKSTLLEVIAAMLGADFAQQAAPELLMQKRFDGHPTELAELRGARLVTAVESGEGRRLNEPLIKQMSGGDRIRARFMRADFFEFAPEFKLFLATNHRPDIKGTDLGIWRRIRLIPFNVQIPEAEVDTEMLEKLKKELTGIFSWSVSGCLSWQKFGRLIPSFEILAATEGYRAEQDVLAGFLADCCVTGKEYRAKAADLFQSYVGWCDETGERADTQRKFGQRLAERGFTRSKSNRFNWWLGIGLSGPEDEDSSAPLAPSAPGWRVQQSSEISRGTQTGIQGAEGARVLPAKVHGEAKQPAIICSWDRWGDRLLTKCNDPSPNDDRTGCANCGAIKPTTA